MLARKIDEYCEFTYGDKVIVGASSSQKTKKIEKAEPVLRARKKLDLDVQLRRKLFCAMAVAALMVMVIALQNKLVIDRSYEIVKMKSEISKIYKDNEVAKLDISKLKAPQRIEQIAVTQLGMTNPKAIYYVKNDTGASDGVYAQKGGNGGVGVAQAAERKRKAKQ